MRFHRASSIRSIRPRRSCAGSAIYNNYRALVDPTPGGGYGTLYGPNVAADGTVTASEGLIAGDEYLAFEKGDDGRRNVTMMVQVPDSFDPANGCIVTAPSSGSRGVYGAIATAGEWGLKHGCAVAYTDKGTGTGADDLQNNTVNLIRGERADAAQAGDDSNFTARLSDSQRALFNAATPNRFAFKHAHSQQNPEKDWGDNVLRSIKFAFKVLNEKFGRPRHGDHQAQHHRDRLERVERRGRLGPRRGAGRRSSHRRPCGRRAQRQSEIHREVHHRAERLPDARRA